MALVSLSSRPIGGPQTAPPWRLFFLTYQGGPTIALGAGPPPVIPTLRRPRNSGSGRSINSHYFLWGQGVLRDLHFFINYCLASVSTKTYCQARFSPVADCRSYCPHATSVLRGRHFAACGERFAARRGREDSQLTHLPNPDSLLSIGNRPG